VACTAEAGGATTIFQGLDCFISGGFRSHKTSMKFKFCGDDINERPSPNRFRIRSWRRRKGDKPYPLTPNY